MQTVVVGLQWGDEGKGKIIDLLAKDYDIIVRYQGGDNAGHTVVLDDGSQIIFHLIPSGLLHKNKIGVITSGVVFNPKSFLDEISLIKKYNNLSNKIYVSKDAHLIMPYHIHLDDNPYIGTTKKGIGPAYTDKVARLGIKVKDLFNEKRLREKLELNFAEKKLNKEFLLEEILKKYLAYGESIKEYIADTLAIIHKAISEDKRILFEGAQGSLLDINYGTYPYVTSSECIASGACTNTGISPKCINEVVGVMKAYTTRVGKGPFITEAQDKISSYLRKVGNEYGATTGRPRRCGWLDLPAIKYAIKINGIDYITLTKLDALNTFEKIKVCVGYKYDNKLLSEEEFDSSLITDAVVEAKYIEPQYIELKGWQKDISWVRSFEDLPIQAKDYVNFIMDSTNVPIKIISVGAKREETIYM
jgi:adenylosuccinate synthase